eukprot:scaffold907_cov247-Pinguiococcus_pyrenoidosus.AAC.14
MGSLLSKNKAAAASSGDVATLTQQLTECKEELKKVIDETNSAPILVRLAWHDSGTHDASSTAEWPMQGGADGSIRFSPEIDHGANAGLTKALAILEPVKAKFPAVSYADLIQMASATAIELCGGPQIPMRYGRLDTTGPDECPAEGNLPGAGPTYGDGAETPQQHLRNIFYRMGFNDQEIVALSGAHTLGRAYKDRSGYGAETSKFTDGSHNPRGDGKEATFHTGGSAWTKNWLVFDNSYFATVPDKDTDPDLLKLDTDKCLFLDEGFLPTAQLYKESQDKFFEDYAVAHAKLSELGAKFEPEEGIRID